MFGSSCYIKINKDDLGKFDSRNDEGIFLGYSSTKKAYRCFNKILHKIVESVDVKVDDVKPRKEKKLDSIENTCDDEIKELQKDESIHNEEEDREKEDTHEDDEDFPKPDTKNLLEGYKRIIQSNRSWVIKMLESKQEDNYWMWNKPYSQ